MLQPLGNVVQNGFAGIIHAPRLHLVGEVALAQLAGLRRRWRRNLHVDRARTRRRETTRIGTSRTYCDRTRRGSRGAESSGAATTRDAAAARGPIADIDRDVVRAGAGTGQGRRGARL